VVASTVPAWLDVDPAEAAWRWAWRVHGLPAPPLDPGDYATTLRHVYRAHGRNAALAAVRHALDVPAPHGVQVDRSVLTMLRDRLQAVTT
jgi:hypothetical protein